MDRDTEQYQKILKLSCSSDAMHRQTVAESHVTPPDILEQMIKDGDVDSKVISRLLRNPNLTAEGLSTALRRWKDADVYDAIWYLRCIARHANTSEEDLMCLLAFNTLDIDTALSQRKNLSHGISTTILRRYFSQIKSLIKLKPTEDTEGLNVNAVVEMAIKLASSGCPLPDNVPVSVIDMLLDYPLPGSLISKLLPLCQKHHSLLNKLCKQVNLPESVFNKLAKDYDLRGQLVASDWAAWAEKRDAIKSIDRWEDYFRIIKMVGLNTKFSNKMFEPLIRLFFLKGMKLFTQDFGDIWATDAYLVCQQDDSGVECIVVRDHEELGSLVLNEYQRRFLDDNTLPLLLAPMMKTN